MTVCKVCNGNQGYCDCIEKCWQCGSPFLEKDSFGSKSDKVRNIKEIADTFHIDFDELIKGKFTTCPKCIKNFHVRAPCHYFLWNNRRFGFYSSWHEFFNEGIGSAERKMKAMNV